MDHRYAAKVTKADLDPGSISFYRQMETSTVIARQFTLPAFIDVLFMYEIVYGRHKYKAFVQSGPATIRNINGNKDVSRDDSLLRIGALGCNSVSPGQN